jgi:predicted RNA binding protein YcfA (HicA-like mRNA interferase family)
VKRRGAINESKYRSLPRFTLHSIFAGARDSFPFDAIVYHVYHSDMPSPSRFAEVQRMLERRGWILNRITGSHHIFTKAGERHISIPVHKGMVKHGYVKEAKKRCGEE